MSSMEINCESASANANITKQPTMLATKTPFSIENILCQNLSNNIGQNSAASGNKHKIATNNTQKSGNVVQSTSSDSKVKNGLINTPSNESTNQHHHSNQNQHRAAEENYNLRIMPNQR